MIVLPRFGEGIKLLSSLLIFRESGRVRVRWIVTCVMPVPLAAVKDYVQSWGFLCATNKSMPA